MKCFDMFKKPEPPRRPQIDSVRECFTLMDPKDKTAAILHVMECKGCHVKDSNTKAAQFMVDAARADQTKRYAHRSGFPPEQFLAMIVDGEMQLHVERLNRIV